MFRLTPTVKKILYLNILFFLISNIFRQYIVDFGALHSIFSEQFRWYQLLTHIFIHLSFWHLFSNAITLVTFGPSVEDRIGSKRFFLFYILIGVGASVCYLLSSYLLNYEPYHMFLKYLSNPSAEVFAEYVKQFPVFYDNNYGFIYDFLHDPTNSDFITKSKSIMAYLYNTHSCSICVGASGAVFGILTAFGMFYPNAQLAPMFLPIGIQSKYIIVFYGLYEFLAGLSNGHDNIAHLAHVGGILIAYIVIKPISRRRY